MEKSVTWRNQVWFANNLWTRRKGLSSLGNLFVTDNSTAASNDMQCYNNRHAAHNL